MALRELTKTTKVSRKRELKEENVSSKKSRTDFFMTKIHALAL